MEKAKQFKKNIYFSFFDHTKVFDCMDHNRLWTTLKEMGVSDHLICLLRNLYAGQEAAVRTGHETRYWLKIRKVVWQRCILSHCLFSFCAVYIMWNAGLNESQAWIKTAGRNNKSQRCRWYHSNGRQWRGTKEPLDESERGEWKDWLESQHSKK